MADDPADWRRALISERDVARRDLIVGVVLIASAVAMVALAMIANDVVLLIATFCVPAALFGAFRLVPRALGRHARASLELRQLHRRKTELPAARLVDHDRR